jgi:hypothetical protein
VPEPPTLAMMIAGFAGLGLAGYRGLRKASALAVVADFGRGRSLEAAQSGTKT